MPPVELPMGTAGLNALAMNCLVAFRLMHGGGRGGIWLLADRAGDDRRRDLDGFR